MERQPFVVATVLGLAGLVPFLVLGAVVLFDPLASPQAITALIGYSAVILSFVGAVHWGFALRSSVPTLPEGAERSLLVFGVVPALLGWVALLAETLGHLPALAIFILIAGFFATSVGETVGRGRGYVQVNYLILRWALSIVVLLVLLVVLFAILAGMRVG
jgi:Protein of unknown function (DUF3429)